MKKIISILLLCVLAAGVCVFCIMSAKKTTITYSLYPYLPDEDSYCAVIEDNWEKLHPETTLQYVDYNCYEDGAPEGIDVIMYDACMESYFVENGYLKSIEESEINNADDFFDFTVDDLYTDGKLYGIPANMCSTFLLYDKSRYEAPSHLDELLEIKGEVMAPVDSYKDYYYVDACIDSGEEYLTDYNFTKGNYNNSESYSSLQQFYEICDPSSVSCDGNDIAEQYGQGEGLAYFGFSETLRFADERIGDTGITSVSFSDDDNTVMFYVDAVGISSRVDDKKTPVCLDLMNLIASSDVMEQACRSDTGYNYLIFPRISFYEQTNDSYGLYDDIFDIIENGNNRVFRYSSSYYQ